MSGDVQRRDKVWGFVVPCLTLTKEDASRRHYEP